VTRPGDADVRTVGAGAHMFACPAAQVPVDTDTGAWGAHAHVLPGGVPAGTGPAAPAAGGTA